MTPEAGADFCEHALAEWAPAFSAGADEWRLFPMAIYGAKGLRVAKITSDAKADAYPVYENAQNMGPLVAVTDTITYAEAKNYGDNELQEYVSEFQELGVDVEITEIPMAVASTIYGAELGEDGSIAYKTEDSAPEVGFAFYTTKMVKKNGVTSKFFQGVFYPSLKGSRQGATYNTKGQSITFANGKARFVGKAAANGVFQEFSDNFTTEAEAIAWLNEKLPLETA